jgi:uncharacterized membrane protein
VAALFVAPIAVVSPHRAMSFGAAAVYAAGSNICHQRPERSFYIAGRQMPVCARCTGLYVSAAIGAPLALLVASAMSARRARIVLVIAALPTLATWTLEYAGIVHFSNAARALCALPLGFVAAWLVTSQLAARPRGRML